MPLPAPSFADVVAAAERIAPQAHRTPVLTSRRIDQDLGLNLFVKAENLQRIGAFKFRGAYNALAQFSPEQRRAGVVAFSSGNHAQAIALAGRILDIPATIVMPSDAPAAKLDATRGYGAEVVTFDRYRDDRAAITEALSAERGLTIIPPYDHPHVIAGQGTAVKEPFEEVGPLDALFVGLGGGGLLSGSALSARALAPACKIYGVEPAAGNDGQQSLRAGEIVHIEPPVTIADGAQTTSLGHYTFDIIKRDVDDIVTATDDELVDGMRVYASVMKIVVEPTGCLAFAAVRRQAAELRGQRVGVIATGGNIDLAQYAALLG